MIRQLDLHRNKVNNRSITSSLTHLLSKRENSSLVGSQCEDPIRTVITQISLGFLNSLQMPIKMVLRLGQKGTPTRESNWFSM